MTDTSSNLPMCIHCGTRRPADETICPSCNKPWIDVNIRTSTPATAATSPETPAVTPPMAMPPPTSLDDTGEFSFDDWTLPPEAKPSRAKWLIPIVLFFAVAALWSLVFLNRNQSQPPTALDTTTTLVPSTTTTVTPTTVAVATTEPPSTTTTLPPPASPSAIEWEASGTPIATADLVLKASGIGPVDLGSTIAETTGALVASLGPAQDAGLETDSCKGTERYWLGWGSLTVYFDGFDSDAVFVAYRNEDVGRDTSGPAFRTLSGLKLGDTIGTLLATYPSYTVTFELLEGQNVFRLLERSELLLWGPVSSVETSGTVEGIFSPDACPESNS